MNVGQDCFLEMFRDGEESEAVSPRGRCWIPVGEHGDDKEGKERRVKGHGVQQTECCLVEVHVLGDV